MTAEPLAGANDVADIWRTLSSAESVRADALCKKASALLRSRRPNIDQRIGWFTSDPVNPAAVDPVVVAAVVAGVVKRVMANPDGVWSSSSSEGPFSASKTFAGSRQGDGSSDSPGDLEITDRDLAKLDPTVIKGKPGTIRLNPTMAPDCDQVSLPAVL